LPDKSLRALDPVTRSPRGALDALYQRKNLLTAA